MIFPRLSELAFWAGVAVSGAVPRALCPRKVINIIFIIPLAASAAISSA